MPRGKKQPKKEEQKEAPHAIVELANGRIVSGYLLGAEDGFVEFRGDDGVTGQVNTNFIVSMWFKEADEPSKED